MQQQQQQQHTDRLGRPREGPSLTSLVPFWAWILAILAFDYKRLRKPLLRDLAIVVSKWPWLVAIPYTVLGVLPLFGSAPYSEVALSWTLLVDGVCLLVVGVVSVIPSVLAWIPLLCVVTTIWTYVRCRDAVIPPDQPVGPEDERWFYVNGICNTRHIALLARARIEELFGRSPTVIFNPTDGVFLDLIECVTGRFGFVTAPSSVATRQIVAALTDPSLRKVVLIGHSQGAIVVSSVLADLARADLTDQQLQKLEVYTFASPASEMNDHRGRVHCEHFANCYDTIAQIGVLVFRYQLPHIYVSQSRHGHILNEHYLADFQDQPYRPLVGAAKSRLYSYLLES